MTSTTYPINLEQEALASYNYLENLIEPETGYTYFNLFLTDPAEAVHDWPDFLDVPSRTAEACVFLRHMTLRAVKVETACFQRIARFQEADGLFRRPESRITRHEYFREEQALVMGALLAKTIADQDDETGWRLKRLVAGLNSQEIGDGSFPAMLIRPVARAWEAFQWPETGELMERLREGVSAIRPIFRPDGGFGGHVHSHLYAAAGLVEVGKITNDQNLVAQMERVFQWIRERSTRFGFVPEVAERQDDVIGCETCCLMDYIHLALALARAGYTDHYDDVELAVRNHLIESRVKDGEWLPAGPETSDDELIRRNDLRSAAVGAYAGWSSPNHILAYDEWLSPHWIKTADLAPIYLKKVRALQNCCGPSGPKAIYLAWQHSAQILNDGAGKTLRINLLLDRSLQEAEVRSFEPFEGRVEVLPAESIRVALRCPSWLSGHEITAKINGRPAPLSRSNGYVGTDAAQRGNRVEFLYPIEEKTEDIAIGNEGRQSYRYRVHWRGSTVTQLEPADNPKFGVTDLMPQSVNLYYGVEGPHPLYQRGDVLKSEPAPRTLNKSAGPGVW